MYSPILGDFGGGFNPLDPSTGTKLWFSSRDTSFMRQSSGGTGAVSADGDPVGYFVDHVAGVTLVQATSGLRPTYKTNIKNSNAVLRFGGNSDQRVLKLGSVPSLVTTKSLTIIATIKNGETTPLQPSYACDFVALGNFPEVEFSLYNSFADPVNVKLTGSGTAYKNGAASPLTMTQNEWLVAQLDVASGFTQTDLDLGGNQGGAFFAAFDLMDLLFIQPTPTAAQLALIYTWIKAPAGL